jgi:outer membrane protein assembly factor BamB
MLNVFRFVLVTSLLAASVSARADDWPQWRGPERNGISKETGLLKSWPTTGPALAWTFENAGMGFSPPAIVGGVVYSMGARGEEELVFAVDSNGKELWTAKIDPVYDFKSNTWSRGPDASPAVDGGLLYALGSQGELVCVETKNGKEVWRKNLRKDLAGEVNNVQGGPDTDKIGWGYTWSPFVDGDKLVCIPGGPEGLFAALDKKTGAVLWRSKGLKDAGTYASPIPADIGGARHYIALVQNGLVAVSAEDGSVLWEYRRDSDYPDVVCATPIVHGDYVYVSVGYGGGCDLLKIEKSGDKFKATPVYANKKPIASRQGGVILVNGLVYGPHEDRAWTCQDFATGAFKWESNRRSVGIGPLVYADGRFYVVSEAKGEVAMFEATPTMYKQLAKFPLPKQSTLRKPRGKIWTHPVIADGKLYLRDQELIFCYQIK